MGLHLNNMPKFTKGHAANLYFESVLWLVCPHANKVPSSMLAMSVAACGSDFVSFSEWCEVCQIIFLPEDEHAKAAEGQPAAVEKISPLSESFPAPQSEMTEDQIIAHNEAALKVIDGFEEGPVEKPLERKNDAPQHVGANGGGV